MTQKRREVAARGKTRPTGEGKAAPAPQPVRLRDFVLVALAIPGLFWLKFGRVDGFAIGFTAFLLVLLGGVAYSDVVAGSEKGGSEEPEPKPARTLSVIFPAVWVLALSVQHCLERGGLTAADSS